MTRLKVRNLPFQFADDTPFQWNPANPFFGFAMNSLSFVAPPFEGWAEMRATLSGRWRFGRMPSKPQYPDQFATVPRMELLRMVYRLVRSQHPRHSPETEQTPPFADEWIAAYDRGRDVVDWYGGAK